MGVFGGWMGRGLGGRREGDDGVMICFTMERAM